MFSAIEMARNIPNKNRFQSSIWPRKIEICVFGDRNGSEHSEKTGFNHRSYLIKSSFLFSAIEMARSIPKTLNSIIDLTS